MNFDDRFLGLISMLGGMGGMNNSNNASPTEKQSQGMNFDSVMNIMGLMQGFSGKSFNATQNQSLCGSVDIMKILPLLTALKSGNSIGNIFNAGNQPSSYSGNAQDTSSDNQSPSPSADLSSQRNGAGYKDKYSAIAFAGNEVIYTLGKLWKTYKE